MACCGHKKKTTIGFNKIPLMDLTCARTYIPDPSSPVGLCCTSHQCSVDLHNNVHTRNITYVCTHTYTYQPFRVCIVHPYPSLYVMDLTSPYVNIDKC